MKNKLKYSLLSSLVFAFVLFVSSNAIAQTTETIEELSSQIASIYGADARTVKMYVEAAVRFESRNGIAAPVVIAIAIHESGLNSFLFLKTGNPFGILANTPWVGPSFSKWQNGVETKYRSYNSPEEAVLDFGNFINSRTWYADARNCPIYDYTCVVNGLKKTDAEPGYSMNPNWDEEVLAIIEKLGLQTLAAR